MQARSAGPRKRFRNIDAQCYDGKADPETDAGRIFDAVAEMVESVAVVEEGGDAEVMGDIADHLECAGDQVLTAVTNLKALAGGGAAGRDLRAHGVDRRQLIVG